jgi:sulfopyruvate decarboxylase subunit alpha
VSGRTARSDAVVDGLREWGLETFVHVPSSHVAPIIEGLEAGGVDGRLANREEEAIGIAGGLALAGRRVAIVMQDNGFGNALTALTTFAKAYHVGLPIVANTRGGPGEYNAMIHSFSDAVPDLLRAAGIRVEALGPAQSPDLWRRTTVACAELALMTHRPIVLLMHLLLPATAEEAA